MINDNEWMIVGLITSPKGINGKIKVKSLSDFEERFTKPGKRWIQKEDKIPIEFELTSGFKKPGKDSFIISFKGINSRNQAENLKTYKVLVKVDDIPNLKNLTPNNNNFIYHAGTEISGDKVHAVGGRVLNFVSISDNYLDCRNEAINLIEKLNWKNGFYRSDIGFKVIDK